MQENEYLRAKDYMSKLENQKWRLQLDEQQMTDLNARTQKALSNLLLKRNVSRAGSGGSNLLLHKLRKLNQKKTIIDIGQLDPLVGVYETKIEDLESENRTSAQEVALLRDAVEVLVAENEDLRSRMETLIKRELSICRDSRKVLEDAEARGFDVKGKLEQVERDKAKELVKIMDSLEIYRLEVEAKEEENRALGEVLAQTQKDLRDAVRREKRLVVEGERLGQVNKELQEEVTEKTGEVELMEGQVEAYQEIKDLVNEENPHKLKRALEKMMRFRNEEHEGKIGSEGEVIRLREELRDLAQEMEYLKMEKQSEGERSEGLQEEINGLKERHQQQGKEKMELFRKLKETEMQLKSLEGSAEGRAKAFEELTEKLKKVIQKKTEQINTLEKNLDSQARKFKGESQKELRDQQKERGDMLRMQREEIEKRESLERAMLVKEEVIKGLKKERDFFRERAETNNENIKPKEDEGLRQKNETLQAKCEQYMKLNMNMARKNKQLQEELDQNLESLENMQREIGKIKSVGGPRGEHSELDDTIEFKKSQNFFFNKKKQSNPTPKMDLNAYFMVIN